MAQVRLENLRKVYAPGVVAVHGASFEVKDGEFVVLVGPSGCGKSTLLRMIAGLESITQGRLYIDGRVVNGAPPKNRDVAMVFQNDALYPHMTVFDNIALGLRLRKYPREETRQRVRRAARLLSIESILDRKPEQLSGGQRQRVAVGRAIVRKPRVFLFDEPLSNLDAGLRVRMRTEIARLHRQLGATTIYVTHDQAEAMTMGNRIVVLDAGHVRQIGVPLDIYEKPQNRFTASFIGSPSMNFLEGTLADDGRSVILSDEDSIRLPNTTHVPNAVRPPTTMRVPVVDGRETPAIAADVERRVVLGIRPEDIRIAGTAVETFPTWDADFLLEMVEPVGHEVIMYARSGEREIVARFPPRELPEPGRPVRLSFDLRKLHVFDAVTGEAIPQAATIKLQAMNHNER